MEQKQTPQSVVFALCSSAALGAANLYYYSQATGAVDKCDLLRTYCLVMGCIQLSHIPLLICTHPLSSDAHSPRCHVRRTSGRLTATPSSPALARALASAVLWRQVRCWPARVARVRPVPWRRVCRV
jgi:hypothetical protein